MKGFTHFMSGVAMGTFFPEAVRMAYQDSSFILVLGGVFGILPDTFDFKFAQFFEKYHYYIDPEPDAPNPREIADAIAKAVNEAHETGEERSILLSTIKKGADLWRQYSIYFDMENKEIVVNMGPLVNTSKKPFKGTELNLPECRAKVNCEFHQRVYDKETRVDIMSGPSFTFVPQKDGKIKIDFIAWHRRWSHSLTLGVFFGFLIWGFMGLLTYFSNSISLADAMLKNFIYGAVVTSGYWIHVIEDQFGYMGNNLFWPFTKEKTLGTKSMHSGDAWPNFLTIWLALTLIFYNLNRFRAERIFETSFFVYFIYVFVIPFAFLKGIEKLLDMYEISNSLHAVKETIELKSEHYKEDIIRETEESF